MDDSLRGSIINLIIAEGGIQHQAILESSPRKLLIDTESCVCAFQN